MAKILVLIRHGKAQPFGSVVEDAARTLTPAGRRALQASLPESLMPLALTNEFVMGVMEVWSSPAVRALETANAAAAMLDIQEIETRQSLYDQDVDAFLGELDECLADVVVAVGHEPFCGKLAERLCGCVLPFKTASAAIFDMGEYEGVPNDSVLRHFSQGPRTQNWKTLTRIEDVLCRAAARVEETMTMFLENPEDVEALHDFRVSVRTLRSELSFLKPYMNPVQAKSLQGKLRDLVVKTSRLRELDVLGEVIAATENPNEELVAAVGKMRKKECDSLLADIGRKKSVKRVCKLLDNVEHIEWKRHVEEAGLTVDDIIARFEYIGLKFEAAYLKADYSDVEATHDLRKAAKRVRYASREFGEILGQVAEGVPQAMRDIQDELGALCDARVNCLIIDDLPKKKLSKEAREQLQAIKQAQIDVIDAIVGQDGIAEAGLDEGFELIEDIERVAQADAQAAEADAPLAGATFTEDEMAELLDEVQDALRFSGVADVADEKNSEDEDNLELREDF